MAGKPSGESRKIRKPMMEKKRRARINESLNELKRLLLDGNASKKEGSRPAKLEKADILEMTVQYMHKLHKQKSEPEKSKTTASTALQKNPKFRAGFSECAREARNLLGRLEGVDSAVQERLSNHLASCLEPLENATVLTLLPTKLPNGDLAFVIPANLKNSMAACVRTETRTANKPEEGPLQEDAVWRPW